MADVVCALWELVSRRAKRLGKRSGPTCGGTPRENWYHPEKSQAIKNPAEAGLVVGHPWPGASYL